jgi:chitinase
MFEALRDALDQVSQETGKTYLLTSAVAGFKSFLDHTEMSKAAAPQDFINVMCYDFYTSGIKAGHHSNLFAPEDYELDRSAAKDIDMFIEAGVPSTKLVLGVPFYGRSWLMMGAEKHGINQLVDSVVRAGGYTFIKDSLVDKQGFEYHWDEKAKSPYLFNQENNQLVVFDDEASIKIKCDYVKDHQLGGVMFWQYLSDPKEYLLDVVNESFHSDPE